MESVQMKTLSKFYLSFAALLGILVTPAFVYAASPDGAGPWADNVVTSSQGDRKVGSNVLATRSNPSAAVGVAENDTNDASFFSLGFGGKQLSKPSSS